MVAAVLTLLWQDVAGVTEPFPLIHPQHISYADHPHFFSKTESFRLTGLLQAESPVFLNRG